MGDLLRLLFIGTVIVTLQWLFFGRLDLWGATPDVVLLFVVWVAVRYGQITGTIAGFSGGFCTGCNLWFMGNPNVCEDGNRLPDWSSEYD